MLLVKAKLEYNYIKEKKNMYVKAQKIEFMVSRYAQISCLSKEMCLVRNIWKELLCCQSLKYDNRELSADKALQTLPQNDFCPPPLKQKWSSDICTWNDGIYYIVGISRGLNPIFGRIFNFIQYKGLNTKSAWAVLEVRHLRLDQSFMATVKKYIL